MLLLVLGANYPVMFIGWEGVGLCSYLLIGFWFKNREYGNAAKKAFIMNRIGDLGFLLGMFLIFSTFGSLNYSDIFSAAKTMPAGNGTIVAITLLLVYRGHRQERTDPALHLAPRCHGRSHAGIRTDPCGHHGDRRRLHDRPVEHSLYAGSGNPCRGVRDRPCNRPVCRQYRDVPERYQESAGLFHHQPARIHVHCTGCRSLYRRPCSISPPMPSSKHCCSLPRAA